MKQFILQNKLLKWMRTILEIGVGIGTVSLKDKICENKIINN